MSHPDQPLVPSCLGPSLRRRPIVDHAVVHKENMAKMKAAYDAGKAAAGGAAAAAAAGGDASGSGRGAKAKASSSKAGDKPSKRARKA